MAIPIAIPVVTKILEMLLTSTAAAGLLYNTFKGQDKRTLPANNSKTQKRRLNLVYPERAEEEIPKIQADAVAMRQRPLIQHVENVNASTSTKPVTNNAVTVAKPVAKPKPVAKQQPVVKSKPAPQFVRQSPILSTLSVPEGLIIKSPEEALRNFPLRIPEQPLLAQTSAPDGLEVGTPEDSLQNTTPQIPLPPPENSDKNDWKKKWKNRREQRRLNAEHARRVQQMDEFANPHKYTPFARYIAPVITSTIGGEIVNGVSRALTGKTIGQNVYTNILEPILPDHWKRWQGTPIIGEFLGETLNPGWHFSPQHLWGAASKFNTFKTSFNNKMSELKHNWHIQTMESDLEKMISERQGIMRKVKEVGDKRSSLYNKGLEYVRSTWRTGPEPRPVRRTTQKPFYSNNENVIRNNFYGTQVKRVSPTELEVTIGGNSFSYNPELKLPDNSAVRLNNAGTTFVLKYPSKKGGRPTVTVKSISLKDLQNIPIEKYYQLPEEVISAIQNELNFVRSTIPVAGNDIKSFGSSVTVLHRDLPHIADDFDFITTGGVYDSKIANNVPLYHTQKTREGFTHAYTYNGETKPLDIVVLRNGPDGLADSSQKITWQLYAKAYPKEYHELMQKAALGEIEAKIPVSAEELLSKFKSYEDSLLDVFIADFRKNKHLNRAYVLMERVDPTTLSELVDRKGRLFFGENYKPLSGIDFSDYAANYRFLQQIGFVSEHPEIIAQNPKRMEAIAQDFYQYLSGVSRGDVIDVDINRPVIETYARVWDPREGGGAAATPFKNTVSLGNSHHGPIYSTRQLDLTPYIMGNSPDDLINFYHKVSGKVDFSPKEQEFLTQVFKGVYDHKILNAKDLRRAGEKLYTMVRDDLLPITKCKEILQNVEKVVPYIQTESYGTGQARGVVASGDQAFTFHNNVVTNFPTEVTEATAARYGKNTQTGIDPDTKTTKAVWDMTEYRRFKDLSDERQQNMIKLLGNKSHALNMQQKGLTEDVAKLQMDEFMKERRIEKVKGLRKKAMWGTAGAGMLSVPVYAVYKGLSWQKFVNSDYYKNLLEENKNITDVEQWNELVENAYEQWEKSN